MSYDDEHLPEPYEMDIGGGKSTFRYARIDVTEAGLVVFEGHRRGVDVLINADGYREAARMTVAQAREFHAALGDVIAFAERDPMAELIEAEIEAGIRDEGGRFTLEEPTPEEWRETRREVAERYRKGPVR